IEHRGTDEAARRKAGELVAFLIPIAKGMTTELAQECTKEALQVYGGHGYIAENGMEQFVRDARIITLYEGTTGIQAADLLGRKILQLQGVGFKHFAGEIGAFCKANAGDARLAAFVAPLGSSGANSRSRWRSACRPTPRSSAPPRRTTCGTPATSRSPTSRRAAWPLPKRARRARRSSRPSATPP